METINQWRDLSFNTLSKMITDIATAFPKFIGAIFVLIIGWVISKIVRFVLKKVLRIAKVSTVSDKINEAKLFGESDFKIDVEKVLLTFVKWMLTLVFVIVAADIAELTVISTEIANLLRYMPVLLSALVIFMIGLFAAKLIKKMLAGIFESMGFSGSKLVSGIVFYILVIFVTITALNQAGIDTSIITNNFTIILGAFLLAFALGFGLGSREMVGRLLKTFYVRKKYSLGDEIKVNGVEGTIESIDHIFLTLKTADGKLVMPIDEVVENRVKLD